MDEPLAVLAVWCHGSAVSPINRHPEEDEFGRGSGAPENNQPRQSSGKVLAFFAVVMMVVAGLRLADSMHRTEVEEFVSTTGVGDLELFSQGDKEANLDDLWREVCRFDGEPLFRRARKPKRFNDLDMLRVGRTDDGKYWLYQPVSDKEGDKYNPVPDPAEEDGAPTYYLRTGDQSIDGKGRYLQVGMQKYRAPE
ncbi:hypothetical protein [Sulfuriroseicoccus oceanibius]|uniref:Uncharacterized protein n=1 Tax=Sulfuriroseicoccus oceanibius TaxID=2707525 RepID=A0A6B3L877_9BACT|nr:hypothetical protein [Sulfuriroseicoccus oceanibius]QQL46297.1 hypothetical protein G3M56_006915 [Sulfuriroseicoccus oceanibius]